jgi:Protein of unknown function (DUF2795)
MPNPIDVQKNLAGVDYPCTKDDLIARAQQNGADQETLDGLKGLPDRSFDGPNAVQQALF